MKGSHFGNAAVTLIGQWAKYLVLLASVIVFSRLLPPEDIGLVAMVTAIVGIGYVLGDFGLSLASIQAVNITQQQKSNLFWIGLVVALTITALSAAAAIPIAVFYGERRLANITLVLSLSFLFSGLAVQHRAELTRDGRYRSLAFIDGASQLVAFIAAVALLLIFDLGYWALVLNTLLAAFVMFCMTMMTSGWRPSLPRRASGTGPLLRFGSQTFATQLVNYLSTNADAMVIGSAFGASTLGVYSRGAQLARLPIQQVASPLTRVVLPMLSRQAEEPEHFGRTVSELQRLVTYGLLAIFSLMAAVADPAVRLFLGDNWSGAAPVVQILCLAGAFQSVGYIYYWVLLARGRTGVLLWSELAGRVLMVILMIVLVQFGTLWVAASIALGQFVILLCGAWFALPEAGLARGVTLKVAVRPFLVLSVAFGAGISMLAVTPSTSSIIELVLGGVAWLLAIGALLLLQPVKKDVTHLLHLARKFRGRGDSI